MRCNSQTSHLGKYYPPEIIGMPHPTAFERKCEFLKLVTFEQQKESVELRAWVDKNKTRYYVPEELLKHWDLTVFVDVY